MTKNPCKVPTRKSGSGKRLAGVTGIGRLPISLENLVAAPLLFEGLSPGQLILLGRSGTEINFAPGQFIFEEGVPANRFYLILEGKVELRSAAKNQGTVSLHIFGRCETPGRTWLFPQEHTNPPHHILSSARAMEPTKALFFSTSYLRRLCHKNRASDYQLTNQVAAVVIENLKDVEQRVLSNTGINAR